jgi:deoxyribose-phosphate aldolase
MVKKKTKRKAGDSLEKIASKKSEESDAPELLTTNSNNEFLLLPGAQGKKHDLIKARVKHVAKALGGANCEYVEKAILCALPHLAKDSPKVRKAVDAEGADVSKYIDHTVLKADTTYDSIAKLCADAKEHNFFAVCVNSSRVVDCKRLLLDTDIKIASVVGFPLGAMEPEIKALEAARALSNGADEIDMVVNIGWLKDGDYARVLADIQGVVDASKGKVKVILEVCLLTEEQIVDGCILCAFAGAEFVKTSTGFSTSGATPESVDLMKTVVGKRCLVKAAGGVKDLATAKKYIAAGISRIGTSSGVQILAGAKPGGGY